MDGRRKPSRKDSMDAYYTSWQHRFPSTDYVFNGHATRYTSKDIDLDPSMQGSYSEATSEAPSRSTPRTVYIVICILVILVVAGVVVAIVTAVLLTNGAKYQYTRAEVKLRVLNVNYTEALSDKTSPEFTALQNSFCSNMGNVVDKDETTTGYQGCTVKSARNGSVVIVALFYFTAQNSAPVQVAVTNIFKPPSSTSSSSATRISIYVIASESVTVVVATVDETSQEKPAVKPVAENTQTSSPDVILQTSSLGVGVHTSSPDVVVQSSSPDVVVQTSSPDVAVQTSSPDIVVQTSSSDVVVQTSSPDVEIKTSSPDVDVQTSSPDVVLQTSNQDLVLQTSSPDLGVQATSSDVVVQTSTPDVVVQTSSPDIDVQTSSPDVVVQTSSPDVEIQTSSPDVDVQSLSPDVNVQTSSLNVVVQLSSRDVVVQTSSPDVVVQTSSPDVEIQTSSPDIDVQTLSPDVNVQTSSLDVVVQTSSTDVVVQISSPDVVVQTSSPDVVVQTSSPDVVVQTSSPDVDVQTLSPDVNVQTSSTDVVVQTSSTDVVVQTSSPDVVVQTSIPDVGVQTSSRDVGVQTSSRDIVLQTSKPDVGVQTSSPDVGVQTSSQNVEIQTSSPDVAVQTLSPDVVVQTSSLDVVVQTSNPDGVFQTSSPDVVVQTSSPDVVVQTSSPDVAVQTSSPDFVLQTSSPDVAVQTSSPDVVVQTSSRDVVVQTSSPDFVLQTSSPDVAVQTSSPDVVVQTSSPDVVVQTSSPDEAVQTSSPDVVVQTSNPDVVVQTSNPDVVVQTSSPDVVVQTSSSDVVVQTSSPDVAVQTSSPDEAAQTSSPDVVVQTSSPDVVVQTSSPDVVVQTSSPDVVVQTSSPDVVFQTSSPDEAVQTSSPDVVVQTSSPDEAVQTSSPDVVVQTSSPDVVVQTSSPDVVVQTSSSVVISTGSAVESASLNTDLSFMTSSVMSDYTSASIYPSPTSYDASSTGLPTISLPPPTLMMDDVSVHQGGGNVVLLCHMDRNYTFSSVHFLKNNALLGQSPDISENRTEFTYMISDPRCTDSGEYECRVVGEEGNLTTAANLTVLDHSGKPTLTLPIEIVEGRWKETSLFVCSYRQGIPPAEVYWSATLANGTTLDRLNFTTQESVVENQTDVCALEATSQFYYGFSMAWNASSVCCNVKEGANATTACGDVYVIPSDTCMNKTGKFEHPYNCQLWIECVSDVVYIATCQKGYCIDLQNDVCVAGPSDGPTGSFSCEGRVSGDRIPRGDTYPSHCKEYYWCVNGAPVNTTCPGSSYFIGNATPTTACTEDYALSYCALKAANETVNGNETVTTVAPAETTTTDPFSCKSRATGDNIPREYTHPSHCRDYYWCVNGAPINRTCPGSSLFIANATQALACTSDYALSFCEQKRTPSSVDGNTTGNATVTTRAPPSKCDCSVYAYIARESTYPGNCTQYYWCVNGGKLPRECGPGQQVYFNISEAILPCTNIPADYYCQHVEDGTLEPCL
ncbi:uncharacterized threonine-rich GPI-anchored glycoprotein PJ4664.02-like isoform X4 [Haliotis rufescens]|uniref:uncharacterized threonine-rich GPI-anchored glycoprotein PJ4664.02-like isoform X4 n=1 Tax=Haliotis rufescens TaxID=6454 RepID=UPI00201EF032|nr:uncharacterized threonine-rich GPI-anchored glycoprotein PJ4664.02-like isoform X4 [Haliotis rufescens]